MGRSRPQADAEAWDEWRAEVDFATRFVAKVPSAGHRRGSPESAWQRRRLMPLSEALARLGMDSLPVKGMLWP